MALIKLILAMDSLDKITPHLSHFKIQLSFLKVKTIIIIMGICLDSIQIIKEKGN